MKRDDRYNEQSELTYKIRIMSGIIVVQLLLLGLIKFWPVTERNTSYQDFEISEDATVLKTPVITRQSGSPPPPPSPQVPVEVPDDEIIEEEIEDFLEFSDIGISDSLSLAAGTQGGSSNKVYSNPELSPSIQYIVEPTIENRTSEKALIYVKFLVDKEGNVQEATISRILLFNNEGEPTIEVPRIDERILSETIEAALEWKFRPAQVNGEPVRAYTQQTFTIDY